MFEGGRAEFLQPARHPSAEEGGQGQGGALQKEKRDGQLQAGGVGGSEALQAAEEWRERLAVFEERDCSQQDAGPCVNEGLEEGELAGYAAEV